VLALVLCFATGVWAQAPQGGQAKKAAKGAKSPEAKRGPAPAKATAGKAAPAAAKKAAPASAKATAGKPATAARRRDPFEPLLAQSSGGIPTTLPPGKAGLVVGTLRLDGVARAPNGMIAVVTNPQQRVYFLREGDQLYNGRVERITMDGITLHEQSKDAFGKLHEELVTKRVYPSAGEKQ